MYRTKIIKIVIAVITLIIISCSEDKNPVNPSSSSNIILNSSFEKNGTPDTEGWEISASPLGEIITDAPSGGGTYCLRLEASNPGGMATRTISTVTDKQIYSLSFWAKTNQPSSKAFFDLIRNSQVEHRTEINVSDTVWTEYSIIDTLQAMSGDSLRITFSERLTQLIFLQSYFDLVKVQTVD